MRFPFIGSRPGPEDSGCCQTGPNIQRHNEATLKMETIRKWLSLGTAAEYLDCSPDTVCRRAIPWQEEGIRGRIRYKLLQLDQDKNKRRERRYFVEDLDALLVSP
jgi:hypothetical protein